VQLKISLFL